MTIQIASIYSIEKRIRQQRDDEERNEEEMEPLMLNEENKITTGMHLYPLSHCPNLELQIHTDGFVHVTVFPFNR